MGLRNNTRALAAAAALTALLASACGTEESETAPDVGAEAAGAVAEANGHDHVDEDEDLEYADDYVEITEDNSEPLGEEHLAEGVEMTNCVAERENIFVEPGASITEDDLAAMCPDNELLTECTDSEALAANADHEPAGWPQDRAEGEPLPDPECHPDFIEVYAWDRFDEFHACWEGPETSSMVRTPDMSDQDVYDSEWERSQMRADWEMPHPDEWGGPNVDLEDDATPECIKVYENYDA